MTGRCPTSRQHAPTRIVARRYAYADHRRVGCGPDGHWAEMVHLSESDRLRHPDQPFHPETPVRENVENCVGYAFKFDHRDWSEYASSRLFLWIRQRVALRSMCSLLRAKVKTHWPLDALSRSDSKSPISTFVEPMPVII
jgi:hypothetical protein